MAINLSPPPPNPIGEVKLWRDFFISIYEILKTGSTSTEGSGALNWNNLSYPTVSNNVVFAGPVNDSGVASFRALTYNDISSALGNWSGSGYLTTVGAISSGTWQGDVVEVPFGGTGFSSYIPGSILYASDADTFEELDTTGSGSLLHSDELGGPPYYDYLLLTDLAGGIIIPLINGGTESDLTTTGGASNVVMQEGVGDPLSVRQLEAADLQDGIIGTGVVVLNTDSELLGITQVAHISQLSTGAATTAGTVTLVAGTATVNTTSMTATALLFFNRKTNGGTIGTTSYTQVNNTSFTINSSSILDTSTFVWHIIETY